MQVRSGPAHPKPGRECVRGREAERERERVREESRECVRGREAGLNTPPAV